MATIKKSINNYSNFKLGKIDKLDIPEGSYDAVVIHYVMHDIKPESRSIYYKFCSKVENQWNIYIQERIGDHGMAAEIRNLMQDIGLKELYLKIKQDDTYGSDHGGHLR